MGIFKTYFKFKQMKKLIFVLTCFALMLGATLAFMVPSKINKLPDKEQVVKTNHEKKIEQFALVESNTISPQQALGNCFISHHDNVKLNNSSQCNNCHAATIKKLQKYSLGNLGHYTRRWQFDSGSIKKLFATIANKKEPATPPPPLGC